MGRKKGKNDMEAKKQEEAPPGRIREVNPLLSSRQKAKSAELLSIQNDIGKGIIYNIRLSRWYLAYCFLMAIATLCLVIFMIVDVHFRKNPVPVWVCVVDGLITFAVCFETIADMILLGKVGVVESLDEFVTVILLTIRYVAQFVRIVRYIRTGAEAQDSLSAAEKHVIRFDRPGGREDPSRSSAVRGGELDF
ncbi:uncharacterized protein EMH_0049320 [Eimeria mitis]|uniref:Ion transport domain-containing protein n=1 Tax=Eimeria mitis TaxID=44415 RepID=U6K0V7_9EIME|nr:uncharacterized protein EMH_0049320 [Eimeria mitis]CDJ29398.1 hypothetical protein, conserved [Eimeria mitis]